MGLAARCLNRPYDHYYLILDAIAWSREPGSELWQRRELSRRLLRCHDTEVRSLPPRDRGSCHASTTSIYSSYERIRPFRVPTLPVIAYYSNGFMSGTDAQQKVEACIAEVELSILSFGAFLQVVRIGPVKQFSFSRVIDECDGRCARMRVPDAMIKDWFDFEILWLTDRMDVDPILTFVAVVRLCEAYWYALGSHDWFPYICKTGKLSRVSWSASMVRKLADGTEEKDAVNGPVHPTYREQFAKRCVLFEFSNAAWLQSLGRKLDYISIPALFSLDALLKSTLVLRYLLRMKVKHLQLFLQSWMMSKMIATRTWRALLDWTM